MDIKARRTALDVPGQVLAEMLNIAPSRLSAIEHGRIDADPALADGIEKLLRRLETLRREWPIVCTHDVAILRAALKASEGEDAVYTAPSAAQSATETSGSET